MEPDPEGTSISSFLPEYLLTLALHDLLELCETKKSENWRFIVDKQAVLLAGAGFGEPLIDLYRLLGEQIGRLLLSRQAEKLLVAASKKTAAPKKKRKAAPTRPTPPVRAGRSGWRMSIPAFRRQFQASKKKSGPKFEAIAKDMGIHVKTLTLYRKRDEIYERLLQERGKAPTEADVDKVLFQNRQKRRSTSGS
jgi:hypothetical protein